VTLAVCLAARRARTQNGALRRLTETPEQALNLNPTLSGDGRRVVFESTADLTGSGAVGFHALRVELVPEPPAFAQLARTRAPAAAVSQDGARVAFASTEDPLGGNADGNSEIFLHAQGALRQLTDTTPADATLRVQQGNFAPSISDDGRLFAFASNRDLTGANADANSEVFLYDDARRAFTQLTDTRNIVGAHSAKLSGDGTHVAYVLDRRADASDPSLSRDLMLHDLTTGRAMPLAQAARKLALAPGRCVSDDGTRVVYAAEPTTNASQVFLYDARAGVVRQLTTLGARATDVTLAPTISGDGARVAFATRRNVSGGNGDASVELYVYDLPANRFTRVTDAPAAATAEVVSSLSDDGALVAFNFPRVLSGPVADADLANNSELYVAALEPRTPFATDLQIKHGATFGREPAADKLVAPDQIAVATGRNLSLVNAQTHPLADGSLPRAFANVALNVNGRAAELLYVSPTQINFVVPPETEAGPALFSVRNHDGYETRGTFTVAPAAPGVFTEAGDGTGAAVALEATTFLRTPFDPVDEQNNARRLTVFATGVRHAASVSVEINGRAQAVETVTPSPGLHGLDEIHVRLERALGGAGLVPLVVRADGRASNPTTIHIGGARQPFRLTLAPATARLGTGRTLRLVATVFDEAGGVIEDAPVTFISTAPDVVRVDSDGTAHALSVGTTVIRATAGALTAEAQLEVYPLTLIINEVLADPPDGIAGDANRDGTRSAAQDEFIELVNASTHDIALGGYRLLVRAGDGADTVRHTFAAGTLLAPGTALVVFGGATAATFDPRDAAFGGAQVFTASTGGLSLTNGGSTVTLADASGADIEQLTYGGASGLPGDRDQSLTRAPDVTGDFTPHRQATGGAARAFSPGTRLDGTPFSPTAPVALITLAPASALLEVGAQQQFEAHAFGADGQELTGVIFRWQTSDAAVASVDAHGLARAHTVGTCAVTVEARGVRSAPALVTVQEPPPVLTRIEVTPSGLTPPVGSELTLPVGVEQQFNARAFDQRGRELNGVAFTWGTSAPTVATINQAGLVNTLTQGMTNVSASAQGVSGSLALTVSAPAVVFNEVLADPPDGAAGDANADGVRSGTDDEFIELVNTTAAPLDLSGWTLRTRPLAGPAEATRHTFAAGTTLAAGDAVVVFGGGAFAPDHPAFGGAQVSAASTGALALTNSGLLISLRDAAGRPAAQFAYGTPADDFGGDAVNQSITRAPDVTGAFTRHTLAPGAAARRFSPGTKLDGAFFAPRAGRLTRVTLAPTAATVNTGQTAQFTAQAFDQFDRPLSGVGFSFDAGDTNVATITAVTTDAEAGRAVATMTGAGAGTTQITAAATQGATVVTSTAATLTVVRPPPVVRRVVVSPGALTLNRGQAQQLTAAAFDEHDQPVPGVAFNWTTGAAQVASVNADGLARATGVGAADIFATAPDGAGGTVSGRATLVVRVPLVVNEILADVPPDDAATANVEGDANRDGVRSSGDDEFVELVNNSDAPLDLSGITLADATAVRFTFPPNTTLDSGRGVVIFGGGAPPAHDPALGGARIFTAGALSLNDGGDTVIVRLPPSGGDTVIAVQSYGSGAPGAPPAPADQSLTRAPDAGTGTPGGSFVAHTAAPQAAARAFSPGTRADGTPFNAPALTRIEVAPATAQLDIGARQTFTARAFANAGGAEVEVPNVSFSWDVNDETKATLAPTAGATTEAQTRAAGSTTVRARAGGQQATALLTVNPPPPVLTRAELTPANATVNTGQTQTFTARAFDQFDQPFTAASYTFIIDDPATATVVTVVADADGSAAAVVRGLMAGTARLTAQATAGPHAVTSAPATLNVGPPPPAPAAGQLIINEALVSFATSATQPRADFVELYNPTAQTLDISGLVITFRPSGSANAPAAVTLPGAPGSLTTLVQPHAYFLVVNGPATFGVAADFDAQAQGLDLNNTTGGLKLELGGVKLDGLTYQGGTAAPAPPFNAYGEGSLLLFTSGTTNDLIRSPNAADTDNNMADFKRNGATASVTPRGANP
jgi:uncharacterized protein (TIGR03437 family)